MGRHFNQWVAGAALGMALGFGSAWAATSPEKADGTAKVDHGAMDHGSGARGTLAPSRSARPARITVPEFAENFRLNDQEGRSHELHYYRNAKAIVLMTQGNACPIVRNSAPDLRAVRDAYADKGVVFYMLNSNLQDTRDAVAKEATDYGFDIPVLMDEHQIIGESLGVTRTAEVFVIDPAQGFRIVYHGPLNDRQSYERQKAEASKPYVRQVLDQMLTGQDVTVQGPPTIPGCLINFPERNANAKSANLTYTKDVAPILVKKCAICHQEGGIGPWAMTEYKVVQGWTPMMREVIRTRRMPPWHADPHIGTFQGDRSLSADEIKTIVHWIEAGAPRGEGEDPLKTAQLVSPDWPLGKPDLILKAPAFTVPATGVIDYEHPVLPNPLTETKWLKATTFKAGARPVVHHILSGYMSEVPEDGKAWTSRWEFSTGGYAVGAESMDYGADAGVPLPAGGAIGLQMHYTPTGRAMTDITEVGLYFHDEKPKYINRSTVILDASIVIPAGASRHKETAYIKFPKDAILIQAFPHAHYRGHASKLTLRRPDGSEEVLVSLPKYDFNWQRSYVFEEPIDIPAGSLLIADTIYDNSELNFANPGADKTVLWGEQTHEEMLYTAMIFRWKDETTDNLKEEYMQLLDRDRMFWSMDDNIDGVLQPAELRGRVGEGLKPHMAKFDADKNGVYSSEEFRTARQTLRRMRQQRRQQKQKGDD